jgi:dihydrofolate reductase
MRPLRFSINITLDGCCDHRAITPDEELHRFHTANFEHADAVLFGRVTYEMMEAAWRPPGQLAAMPDWTLPFAKAIDAVKKYVVSRTLTRVDWNAELVNGDLAQAVQELKRQPGKAVYVAGLQLAVALTDLRLIDEYELVVQPIIAGHGPTLFAGLRDPIALRLVDRREFSSGALVLRYRPA